jgi:alpha-L-fucosidase 2
MDTNYLKEYAYPLMKGAATFCLDFLVEAGDGYMVTAPNTSPENMYINDTGYSGSCLYGATADMAMIRELFLDVISASYITGDFAIREEIEAMLQRLPPYKIGQKGNLQEWYYDWEDRDPQHRHVSHLFALFPGNTIHPELNPELADACRRTLEIRTNNGTGWSIAWKISLWARLRDGEMALDAINKLLHLDENNGSKGYHGGGTYPNLLDAHPPFQIDGNFGGTAGIAEMLLYSKLNEITLLPALPHSWTEGEIRGLRARGAYTVDIEWKNGKLGQAKVIPDFDGSFTVKYGEQSMKFDGSRGKEVLVRF